MFLLARDVCCSRRELSLQFLFDYKMSLWKRTSLNQVSKNRCLVKYEAAFTVVGKYLTCSWSRLSLKKLVDVHVSQASRVKYI